MEKELISSLLDRFALEVVESVENVILIFYKIANNIL